MKLDERVEQFVAVKALDAKTLFDHVRNYLIAGALMYAAFWFSVRGDLVLGSIDVGPVLGFLILLASAMLFAVNLLQSIFMYQLAAGKPRHFRGKVLLYLSFVPMFFISVSIWSAETSRASTAYKTEGSLPSAQCNAHVIDQPLSPSGGQKVALP